MGTLAVDIGGTKILAGLVGPDGAASAMRQVPTPAQEGPEAIIAAVLGLCRGILAQAPGVSACGVGTAGVVGRDGAITSATDLLKDWAGTPLGERLQVELGLPVTVLNDVHATGFCEARIGAAAGAASALVVAVGTGIGGSLVLDGRLVPGRNGIAGSVGHVPSPLRQGRRCSCGALDHVEAYASGPAMEAEYTRRTGKVMDLRRIAALTQGDEVARAVIGEGAAALGTAHRGGQQRCRRRGGGDRRRRRGARRSLPRAAPSRLSGRRAGPGQGDADRCHAARSSRLPDRRRARGAAGCYASSMSFWARAITGGSIILPSSSNGPARAAAALSTRFAQSRSASLGAKAALSTGTTEGWTHVAPSKPWARASAAAAAMAVEVGIVGDRAEQAERQLALGLRGIVQPAAWASRSTSGVGVPPERRREVLAAEARPITRPTAAMARASSSAAGCSRWR